MRNNHSTTDETPPPLPVPAAAIKPYIVSSNGPPQVPITLAKNRPPIYPCKGSGLHLGEGGEKRGGGFLTTNETINGAFRAEERGIAGGTPEACHESGVGVTLLPRGVNSGNKTGKLGVITIGGMIPVLEFRPAWHGIEQ